MTASYRCGRTSTFTVGSSTWEPESRVERQTDCWSSSSYPSLRKPPSMPSREGWHSDSWSPEQYSTAQRSSSSTNRQQASTRKVASLSGSFCGVLNAEGQTILLTTHYMEEADQLCRRVAIMDHGKILALGTPAELKRSVGADTIVNMKTTGEPRLLAEVLTKDVEGVARTREIAGGVEIDVKGSDRIVPHIVNSAEAAGFDVVELSVSEPSLETVFISLTGKEFRD